MEDQNKTLEWDSLLISDQIVFNINKKLDTVMDTNYWLGNNRSRSTLITLMQQMKVHQIYKALLTNLKKHINGNTIAWRLQDPTFPTRPITQREYY